MERESVDGSGEEEEEYSNGRCRNKSRRAALHEYTALRRGVRVSEVMVGGKKMAACCGEDCIPSYLLREGITYRFFEAGEVRRAGEVRERFEG